MEKYIFTFDYYSPLVYEGELLKEDINFVKSGTMVIIRVSDLKVLETDGITWLEMNKVNRYS